MPDLSKRGRSVPASPIRKLVPHAVAAKERGVLTCDASSAERSEFIFGALHRGNGLAVAVFTDGADPSLARNTRDRIAAFLSEGKGPDRSAAG